MSVRTAYAGTVADGDVYTASNHSRMPGGWIGYAEVTANQTGITAETDLTGLTVTVTVNTSRRIMVSAFVQVTRTVADGSTNLFIKEGAAHLQEADPDAETLWPVAVSVVLTPSAGSHTYKLALARGTGTGTVGITADTGRPNYIYVTDVGPAS